jgi:hypothetical protein
MLSYHVYMHNGETYLGVRLLWDWDAAALRSKGYILELV